MDVGTSLAAQGGGFLESMGARACRHVGARLGRLRAERTPLSTGSLCWKEKAWNRWRKARAARPHYSTCPQRLPAGIAVCYRYDVGQHAGRALAAERCATMGGLHTYPGAYGLTPRLRTQTAKLFLGTQEQREACYG